MGITKDILDRIQAIERTIVYDSSAVSVAEYIPEDIQPFQLPLFVNVPRPLTRRQTADTMFLLSRTWDLELWYRKEGDRGRAENEYMGYDLIDLTYAAFLTAQRLELSGVGLTGLDSATFTGDGGVSIEPYPRGSADNKSYYLVRFNLITTYRSDCLD